MDIVVTLADSRSPCTLRQVISALKAQDFSVTHEHKNWGDWLRLDGCETVISIECIHGMTSSATIEHSDDDSEEVLPAIYRAFDHLGWQGIDEDGHYQLV